MSLTERNDMTIDVIPTGAMLGAEIRGVDGSRPIPEETRQAILDAWHRNLVLLFRDQHLDVEAHLRFAGVFGDLDLPAQGLLGLGRERHMPDEIPEQVNIISNIEENGKAIGALGADEARWHTDSSFVERPIGASVLYGIEIPPEGGNTSFLNMYAALEELPPALRRRIEGRKALHSCVYSSNGERRPEFDEVADVSKGPGPLHPLIRTHPATGRQCLFLGRRLKSYIPGLPVDESEELLDALWAHATQPRYAWEHRWRPGDVVVWDNRCTMHHRKPFDPNSRRRMHKVHTMGEIPA